MGNEGSSHPSYSAAAMNLRRQKESKYTRRAHHAGSWYESSPSDLDASLSSFLSKAEKEGSNDNGTAASPTPRAIISPHAGYKYSGPTAAHAFLGLSEAVSKGSVSTIVVLHPSHHVRLNGCAVSGASKCETPLGALKVDDNLRDEIVKLGSFEVMSQAVDENEHSGEMQYPFIAKCLSDFSKLESTTILPIMVGALNSSQETLFGKGISSILSRPGIFTVVSSDFCHWGRRFGYSPHDPARGEKIFDYITWLDQTGMDHIQMQNPGAFAQYFRDYSNTICGRHPIAVWLNSVKENAESGGEVLEIKFVKYEQSGKVEDADESSVSYASAVATKVVTP